MGTTTVITSDAVTQLESDITDLTSKLNGVIIEYNKVQADMTTNLVAINALKTQFNFAESDLTDHKNKINTLITDVEDINDKISDGYTPATSGSNYNSSGDSILLRLEQLDVEVANFDTNFAAHKAGNYTSSAVHNVGSGGGANRGSGSSTYSNGITPLATPTTGTAADSSTAITAVTNDDSTSTAETTVTPSYSTGEVKVVTLGNKGEIRGKKLARQTLNRLRK